MSDDDLFRETLGDVKPLKDSGRVFIPKPTADSEQKQYSRRMAESHVQSAEASSLQPGVVSDDYVKMLSPLDVLSFKRPGIQDGVFRKLRLGKYPIDGKLDLHRRTVQEARRDLIAFIREGIACDARTVLVLHGKGERNPERQAVLKSHTAKWLEEFPDVMAYHSAQQKHGGVGAVYVLLRKSEKLKAENREKHGHRA